MNRVWITAESLAKEHGISAQRFRQALRAERFSWHGRHDRWVAMQGSQRHRDMERVVRRLAARKAVA